ncbi:hypothetical protein L596_017794 [Steinernema carpocapsae]|uniref:Uncharacterized protein n=1 Tax=Steinernema carpocapsae TaxID=34508 RepID=A0A4V6A1U1_STECR|nr:hypothetical protein L596_017794 [Steinernema carpocapsae]
MRFWAWWMKSLSDPDVHFFGFGVDDVLERLVQGGDFRANIIYINGLHLVDFAPEKILINKECLVGYHRLHSTIDLPAYDVAVQEPSMKRPFNFNKRQNVKQVVTTPVAIQKLAKSRSKKHSYCTAK